MEIQAKTASSPSAGLHGYTYGCHKRHATMLPLIFALLGSRISMFSSMLRHASHLAQYRDAWMYRASMANAKDVQLSSFLASVKSTFEKEIC
jgi:hypothetical protein